MADCSNTACRFSLGNVLASLVSPDKHPSVSRLAMESIFGYLAAHVSDDEISGLDLFTMTSPRPLGL